LGKGSPEAIKAFGKGIVETWTVWNQPGHSVGFVVRQTVVNQERGCRFRFLRQIRMDDPVTTIPDLVLVDAPPARSSRIARDNTPSAWPSSGPKRIDRYSPRPIVAVDSLTFKRDKKSGAISFGIHAAVITFVLVLAIKARTTVIADQTTIVLPLDFTLSTPPMTLPVAKSMGGGGGGGAHEIVEASKGHLPTNIAKMQIMPPQVIRIDQPKLGIEPTEVVEIPDNNILPNFGVASSPQVALASQGRGSGSGFGQGLGGGIGAGRGSGAGPGIGGYGGGLMSVGGGVSAPQVIHSVEPEFTDDARKANYQGNASIKLIVDSQGNPQDVRLVSHLGMGLDQKAIEAVNQYKFKPAMYQGHSVSVQIVIDVDFHLH
jgi:periplasmic protein TonB